jgi:hypothetical protein
MKPRSTKINFVGLGPADSQTTYRYGSVFWANGALSMLVQVDSSKIAAISLAGFDAGNRWTDPIQVKFVGSITAKEVSQALGTDAFVHVPEISITIPKGDE